MPVLVEDAAEAVTSVDVKAGDRVRPGGSVRAMGAVAGVADSLVRPVRVAELLELAQSVEQVRLVPDQGPVEQFAAAGLHPSLHDRVHSRHLNPAEHDLDPSVLEHCIEQAGELAVTVPDQEPRPAAGVLKFHDQVPRGLGYPGRSRMSGCAQDPDPATGMLDHCQHVQAGPG